MKKIYNNKLSASELSFFCMQIALILKSGMLIPEGVYSMYNDVEEGRVKDALGILKDELSNKVPLYVAMEKSGCFPSYLINMSQIGSLTGSLENVMKSLSEYYDRDEFIKIKIKNSIFYPSMLFVMMSFVIILLVTKIFPIFENMIYELGGELSNEASALMSFSNGIMAGKFTMTFVILILFLILVSFISFKTKVGKLVFSKFLERFILTRSIVKKITVYRFTSSMSLLLSSGMNIDKSINILLDIVEESSLKNKIETCSKAIEEGDSFIESLSRLSLFSNMHLQMLHMGQRTGEIDSVMVKLTNIYENEAEQALNSSVALIEPILVGILSIVIGFILISVMIPLMNIMSSIG
ncbi:type IV pilus assembly protein PilC [Sedimentibacter acidaminivorans]|uniref:Type IV pilus assembly protein PilC n=1 Tax=Sedimentibacter acidaminivorans TaxID=913099 RepID=A0ABS4GEX0_9FIRM|nr:type II secretion system F family protein [Sedimentibacter acidaminivorans]MBP1926241.1 type IV pilus assembly protein PilC [Sedimentibacter acidaminivorans]